MTNIRQIEGFNGRYFICSNGDVYSGKKKLNPWRVNVSYYKVRLYGDCGYKDFYVHRLVAIYFIENRFNKPCVNHIDSNPSNNDVSNLEWCTHLENIRHASLKGRMGLDGIKVKHIRTGKIYNSIKLASEDLNIKPNTLVYRILRQSKINELIVIN